MVKLKSYLERGIFLLLLYGVIALKVFAVTTQEVTTQEVTILADDGYPPYSFIENGKAKGIYVDIVKEAAKFLAPHFRVKIIAYPWKRALYEIEKGTAFAILPPYQHIEKRPYIWPYSVPILKEEVVAFCNKEVDLLEHISGGETTQRESALMIGVNAGYLLLNETLEQAKKENKIIIAENKSTRSNILKLYIKRIDCYLNDKYSTYSELSIMKENMTINFDNIQESLLVMIQTGHIGYTDVLSETFFFKDDFIIRMDESLSRLKSSETYQKIISSYIIKR